MQPGPRNDLATDGQPGSGRPLGQRWSAWAPWSVEASRTPLPRGWQGRLGHREAVEAQLGASVWDRLDYRIGAQRGPGGQWVCVAGDGLGAL